MTTIVHVKSTKSLRLSLHCKSVRRHSPSGTFVSSRFIAMTLTELPEDVVKMELDRSCRKRPRSDSRQNNGLQVSRPKNEDVPIPPIQVDKDLLIQVVRVKVQTLIRNAKLREQGLDQEPGKKHDPQCTAARLERLLPVIEQRWLQDLMNGDEPRYGFDEVVKVFQDIVHNDSDIGTSSG